MARKFKIISLLVMTSLFLLPAVPAFARVDPTTDGGSTPTSTTTSKPASATTDDPNCNEAKPTNQSLSKCLSNNPIVKYLNIIVDVLSAGVGIVVVIMIIIGGIQYSAAGDKPDALSAAKKRISNALIALVAYALIYSFLQWIIPGGAFN